MRTLVPLAMLIVLLGLPVVASGCTAAPATEPIPSDVSQVPTDEAAAAPPEAALAATATVTGTVGTTAYESSAGYSLAVPASWEGHHTVAEASPEDAQALGATSVTRFLYTPEDAALTPMPLVTLITFTPEQWSAIGAQGGPPVGVEVAQCDGMIVVAATPQSNPYGSETPDGATFDELYMDLNLADGVTCAEAP